jgi:hypothetical protein
MDNARTETEAATLRLGWQTDSDQHPVHWLNSHTERIANHALIRLSAYSMARHALVVAQSGSGKSFFLGRLLEELLSNTSARCLVLDPNADFRKVHEIVDERRWQTASYDMRAGIGWLPTERCRREFADRWEEIRKKVNMMGFSEESDDEVATARSDEVAPVRLWWPLVNLASMYGEVPPMRSSELFHCHTLVKGLGTFFTLKFRAGLIVPRDDFFSEVEIILTSPPRVARNWFNERYEYKSLHDALVGKSISNFTYQDRPADVKNELAHLLRTFIDDAVRIRDVIKSDIVDFYLARIEQYKASGILGTRPPIEEPGGASPVQLEVLDLPSLPNRNIRLLAVNEILTNEWEKAKTQLAEALEKEPGDDTRVPVFIVVDEAHNLMPEMARGSLDGAIKEQFRTIAAEGRKYGIFLLAVTQRPEKLDRFITSECENVAIMKLSSGSAAIEVSQALSLPSTPIRLEELKKGRFVLFGPWAQREGIVGYTAGRRTREGGRDLPKSWATLS